MCLNHRPEAGKTVAARSPKMTMTVNLHCSSTSSIEGIKASPSMWQMTIASESRFKSQSYWGDVLHCCSIPWLNIDRLLIIQCDYRITLDPKNLCLIPMHMTLWFYSGACLHFRTHTWKARGRRSTPHFPFHVPLLKSLGRAQQQDPKTALTWQTWLILP